MHDGFVGLMKNVHKLYSNTCEVVKIFQNIYFNAGDLIPAIKILKSISCSFFFVHAENLHCDVSMCLYDFEILITAAFVVMIMFV